MLTNFKCNHCGCIIKSMVDHHKELCPECNIGFLIKESKEEIINKKLLY